MRIARLKYVAKDRLCLETTLQFLKSADTGVRVPIKFVFGFSRQKKRKKKKKKNKTTPPYKKTTKTNKKAPQTNKQKKTQPNFQRTSVLLALNCQYNLCICFKNSQHIGKLVITLW